MESRLSVYYKNLNSRMDVTARVELDEPETVSLMVFDGNGRHVFSAGILKNTRISETDLHLPGAGIYIIKAFTSEGEYSI
jgi:hypothetical protein